MDRFQELLEERQESKDTLLTAESVWAQVEPQVEGEQAFRDCPAHGRLRVWLKVLARLVLEQKQRWDEEDAERFRRERKSAPLHLCAPSRAGRGASSCSSACPSQRTPIHASHINWFTVLRIPCSSRKSLASALHRLGMLSSHKMCTYMILLCMCTDRDNFRALLKKHREQGVLKAKTKWRKYRDIIRKEYEFLCMETNLSGSRPRELFADVVADLNDRYNQDAVKVKAALRAADFTVSKETDWTDFQAALHPPDMQERLQ